jgi:hypothetical protein
MVRRDDTTSSTVQAVKMVKKAAGAGGRMARVAIARAVMRTVVPDTCIATARPGVTDRHATATNPAVTDVRKVRRVVMAPAASTGLAPMVHIIRQVPPPTNHIRPAHLRNQQKTKATQNRMPPFDLSS